VLTVSKAGLLKKEARLKRANDKKRTDHMQERFDRTWNHPSWWNLLIVLPWAIGLVVTIYGLVNNRTVAQREKSTYGRITAHEAANHNRYGYSFLVNHKSYSGWESPTKAEPYIGQQVTVFYDPLDPTKNALTDFVDQADNLGPIPMMLLGIGAVTLFIWYRRRDSRDSRN